MYSMIAVVLTFIALTNAYSIVRQNESEHYDLVNIIGGEPATPSQAPWQTLTVLRTVFEERDLCGGSLIGKRAVLTAAHCCDQYEMTDMRVKYGGIDRTTLLYESKVIHKIVYPGWNRAKHDGDYCVLILEEEVIESAHVRIIDIADKEPAAGDRADLTGWGATSYGSSMPTALRFTELTIMSRSACSAKWTSGGIHITHNMICAESKTSSGCEGDSGGPLVVSNKLVGSVSWGHKECPKDTTVWPTIYSNNVHGKKWIMDQVYDFS